MNDDFTPTPMLDDENTEDMGLQALATACGLNRRKNQRFTYPKGKHGPLPQLSIPSKALVAMNISSGGFAINSLSSQLIISIGDEVNVTVSWPRESIIHRAIMVNSSRGRFHFRWVNEFPELQKLLDPLRMSAVIGGKIKPLHSYLDDVMVEFDELWLGNTGEIITFYRSAERNVDVYMRMGTAETTIQWDPLKITTSQKEITYRQLSHWFVALAQISSPSSYIERLINCFADQLLKLPLPVQEGH